jgi:hypothetical protein
VRFGRDDGRRTDGDLSVHQAVVIRILLYRRFKKVGWLE